MPTFGLTKEQYLELADYHNDPIHARKTCIYSGQQFAIYESEVTMLTKLSPKLGSQIFELPLPVAAPHVRKLLRTMRKNERNLYYHTCDLTGKKSISRIHPKAGFSVCTNEARASDAWETCDYGMDRTGGSVMEYIHKLASATPYQDLIGALSNTRNNALYTNYTADITDSYLVFDAHTIKNCYYLTKARRCNDCVDGINLADCQRCIGCTDCHSCYGSVHLTRCASCVSSWYLVDCMSCEDCIGCVGLEHKKYHVYNTPYSKEEYIHFKKQFIEGGGQLDTLKRSSLWSHHQAPATITMSENASGTSIHSSKNIFRGTDILGCEDMIWCDAMSQTQDCMDVSSYGHESSRMYQCSQAGRYSSNLIGCANIGKSEHLLYCIDTKKSRHCFGCVNMKGKEYCIFNTQYTKEEYFTLVPKLIVSMQHDGSRGQFLPTTCNVIAYNDSKAYEQHPVAQVKDQSGTTLYENEAGVGEVCLLENSPVSQAMLSLGGEPITVLWRTEDQNVVQSETSVIEGSSLPVLSTSITAMQLDRPIRCVSTGKLYRIMKPELDIYQSLNCPLPNVHQNVRYEEMIKKVKS